MFEAEGTTLQTFQETWLETREEAGNEGAGLPRKQRRAIEVFSGGTGQFSFVV